MSDTAKFILGVAIILVLGVGIAALLVVWLS
jgi:hypothetical protein